MLALAAGACTTPPTAPEADLIAGRLALQVAAHEDRPAHSLSAAFELRGNAAAGRLALTTPLGTTLAQASWQPGAATLVTRDGASRYDDLDALTRRMLGESLPLAALFDWLRGRPWAAAPVQPRADGFEQLGWIVDLRRHADGWVQLERPSPPAAQVRLRLDPPS